MLGQGKPACTDLWGSFVHNLLRSSRAEPQKCVFEKWCLVDIAHACVLSYPLPAQVKGGLTVLHPFGVDLLEAG